MFHCFIESFHSNTFGILYWHGWLWYPQFRWTLLIFMFHHHQPTSRCFYVALYWKEKMEMCARAHTHRHTHIKYPLMPMHTLSNTYAYARTLMWTHSHTFAFASSLFSVRETFVMLKHAFNCFLQVNASCFITPAYTVPPSPCFLPPVIIHILSILMLLA